MYTHCPIIVAVTGLAILITGIVCAWYGFPALIEWQINQHTILKNGTEAFNVWENQPFPLLFKVYLFNVTNTEEAMKGFTPILNEVGPYVYDLHIKRRIVTVDENADTIKYFLKKEYHFNSEASTCRSEYDVVTIINAPLMGTLLKVESIAPHMLQMVNEGYRYIYPDVKDMFLRSQVKDLLFDGITLYCSAKEIKTLCSAMKFALPTTMKRATNNQDFIFSMLGKFNETSFGPFVMTRGIKNTTRGSIISYDDDPELDYWSGDLCNMLNGSDSGLYQRMNKPLDKIYTFTPEVCRSVAVSFEKKIMERNLVAYKYSVTEKTLSHEGSDKCFCQNVDDKDQYECPQDGLLNLDSCLRAPVLMSHPHFYLADKSLLNYTHGLNPRKDNHESFLIIEPITATPIKGAKRSQMNVQIKQFDLFPLTSNMSEGVFPILWIEEGVELPANLMARLVDSFQKITILEFIKYILIVGGILLILVSFVLVMKSEGLMCFAEKGNVPINDGKNMVHHIKVYDDISFKSSSMLPRPDDPILKARSVYNNNSHAAWPAK